METVVIDEDTLSSEKNNERVVAHQNLREAALVCGVASEVQLEVENLLEEDRSSGKVVFHPQWVCCFNTHPVTKTSEYLWVYQLFVRICTATIVTMSTASVQKKSRSAESRGFDRVGLKSTSSRPGWHHYTITKTLPHKQRETRPQNRFQFLGNTEKYKNYQELDVTSWTRCSKYENSTKTRMQFLDWMLQRQKRQKVIVKNKERWTSKKFKSRKNTKFARKPVLDF